MSNASYLKLKDKISKLEKDLNTLVFRPDSIDAELIRARKGFKRDIVNSICSGTRTTDLKTGGGIMNNVELYEQDSGILFFKKHKINDKLK